MYINFLIYQKLLLFLLTLALPNIVCKEYFLTLEKVDSPVSLDCSLDGGRSVSKDRWQPWERQLQVYQLREDLHPELQLEETLGLRMWTRTEVQVWKLRQEIQAESGSAGAPCICSRFQQRRRKNYFK